MLMCVGRVCSPEGMGVTNDTSRCADEEWGEEYRQDGRETFILEETWVTLEASFIKSLYKLLFKVQPAGLCFLEK